MPPKNMEEVHTVVNLVKRYYRDERRVCIITPYDGQRAALVAALKAAGLPHANVYNVDSYQGASLYPFSFLFFPPALVGDLTSKPSWIKNRTRSSAGDRLCRAHDRAGVPQVAEPHERHAHAVSGGHGRRHEPRVPLRTRQEDAPWETR